ncbi:hypothetical protein C475_05155 [Halosimplex carlsbadense 2-9-1]|uniref:Uncharacterized protein n=1 Tax=Halosimplex carlsbadense 2-9-1 TaxID=797114 RepID=M0CY57_9EURY|nr:hypothetical protein [Halosimplex carlsbadense]ELZ28166.1 hypothetical protein C475_05155 [Halosimplex carlsbadense 2-9-1]
MIDFRTFAAGSSALGGLIWLATPLFPVLYRLSPSFRPRLLFVVAPLLVAVGLVGFDDAYRGTYGTIGRVGTGLVAVGVPLIGLGPLVQLLGFGLSPGVLFMLGAYAGAAVAGAGAIAVAVDVWRTGAPSRRLVVWLPLGVTATALATFPAAIVVPRSLARFDVFAVVAGLAWLAVGYYTLASGDDTAAPA